MTAPRHLIALRHALHRAPELSGAEHATAARIAAWLRAAGSDCVLTGLGGHGVAAMTDGAAPGPTVLLRAELDALPIAEASGAPHASGHAGVAHLCGHDGHMAMLCGLAGWRPARGRVVLLFQPAEETGAGARAVLADPRMAALAPDHAIALHNMPGLPLGHVAVAPGPAACASVGWQVTLRGRDAHAAFAETGLSPAPLLARLIDRLAAQPAGVDGATATLCHVAMGAPAFGIAPGRLVAHVTLRARSDAGLAALERDLNAWLQAQAGALAVALTRHDRFDATVNDAKTVAHVRAACAAQGVPLADYPFPMPASEDFGAFTARGPCALVLLGAGPAQPALHDPAYDFPDALLAPGVALLRAVAAQVTG